MSDKSIGKVLQEFFPKSTRIDWKNIAVSETNEKDFEFLSWTGKDDILFLPYYECDDSANLDYLSRFQLPPDKDSFAGARFWVNLPAIEVKEQIKPNEIALNHLSNGADGVLFDLRQLEKANLNQLMDKIEWQYCFVGFHLNDPSLLAPLSAIIKNEYDAASIKGALFWESIPKKINLDYYFQNCGLFKSLGLVIPSASPTVEISNALFEGVKIFESYSGSEHRESIFKSVCFSLSLDHSFFECMAKLKALRLLWFQVAQSYSLNDYKISDLHLHTRCEALAPNNLSGPENLLRFTFSAMSTVLGGCDSYTIYSPHDQVMMSRLARNVSNILKEESFFNKVADPLAGAYAMDVMVDRIAKRAWELFQVKWKSS